MGLETFPFMDPIKDSPAQEGNPFVLDSNEQTELSDTEQSAKELREIIESSRQYVEQNPFLKDERDWKDLLSETEKALGNKELRLEEFRALKLRLQEARDQWASQIFSGKDNSPKNIS